MLDNLTAIIPYFNGEETLDKLIMSLPRKLPIIIVDDISDRILKLKHYDNSNIKVIRLKEKGYFSGACNTGIQACDTDVLILNQDVWFEDMRWYQTIDNNREQYALIGERIKGGHPTFGPLGYAHGTFLFLRRDALEKIGLFSNLYPLWGATAEWQLRATRKGFQVLPLEEIPGFHHDRPKNEAYGSSIKELLDKEPFNKEILVRTPPLLSVIIPCYNYGYLLEDCINSLIGGPTSLGEMPGQTLQSFEVIIVNDASTDSSAEVIDRLTIREQGIKAYHLKQNVGTAQALNYGIARAVGKYITFLSADDMREPDSLAKLVRCCEENPHSFAYDDIWLFYRHQRIKKWEMEEYDFEKTLQKNQIHAGIVFPKAAWEDVGGYPAIMRDGREDWAFNIALGIKGWCGVHVRQFGYLYRREGQNRTETNTSGYHMDYFRDKIRSLFPKIYGGDRPMACCGKGNNTARSNVAAKSSSISQNGARMASNVVGAAGMVKLQYLGKKMSSIWPGHVTNVDYVFGADKTTGWVDRRDVGERGKSGFLNSKDRDGQWLFNPAVSAKTAVIEEPVEVIREVAPQVAENSNGMQGAAVATASLSVVEKVLDVPNPTDMNAEEIKRLNLDKNQWIEVYKIELANRSRKGVKAFLEEKLASFA